MILCVRLWWKALSPSFHSIIGNHCFYLHTEATRCQTWPQMASPCCAQTAYSPLRTAAGRAREKEAGRRKERRARKVQRLRVINKCNVSAMLRNVPLEVIMLCRKECCIMLMADDFYNGIRRYFPKLCHSAFVFMISMPKQSHEKKKLNSIIISSFKFLCGVTNPLAYLSTSVTYILLTKVTTGAMITHCKHNITTANYCR